MGDGEILKNQKKQLFLKQYYRRRNHERGHFDHKQAYLGCIADQLEEDIQYNDIPWNQPVIKDDDEYSGHQFSSETIAFMKDTVKKLRDL